ncbi:MAG: permease, partial [Rhodospirillales bacterium]
MSDQTVTRRPSQFLPNLLKISGVAIILISFFWPEQVWPLVVFVVKSLAGVAAIVIPGIFLAAWVTASGAGDRIAKVFEGRIGYTVVVASAIGAVTPVCGVTVLPLMAGLLAAGVPLAPVMAFWLSSPVTDPPMFATTVAMLGMSFAIGKTLAAFFLGISGGLVTAFFFSRSWYRKPLRENAIVGSLGATSCGAPVSCEPAVWKFPERRKRFSKEAWSITRLILICLIPAFAAEYALNALLQPEALTPYIGAGKWWAVPMAVFVGAPAYLDG